MGLSGLAGLQSCWPAVSVLDSISDDLGDVQGESHSLGNDAEIEFD